MKKIFIFLFTILIIGESYAAEFPKLLFFYSPSCKDCLETKAEIMPGIDSGFRDRIEIDYLNINDIENYKLLLSLKQKYSPDIKIEVPVCYFKGRFFIGKEDVKANLEKALNESLNSAYKNGVLPAVNLIEKFKALSPLVIIGAGLIDGVNPCAFTVIVFFMSFLALQGYKKRELFIIGLVFILTVMLTYLLIGIGLFNALYSIRSFWLIAKVFNLSIGALSIVLGIFAVYDFLKFRKTGQTEGLLLQLPKPLKRQINKVIGLHYRSLDKDESNLAKRSLMSLILSALITGFIISLLEAICTGQTYLPTITFVLKTTELKFQALLYLLLYNSMFIIPLLLIFLFALFGATSEQFSKFLKKNLLWIKLLMAILFFGLGIFLIWGA